LRVIDNDYKKLNGVKYELAISWGIGELSDKQAAHF
jgi:hypothetical protein